MKIRFVHPTDYQPIITVIDQWWGGRKMSGMLPKLFFIHFCKTSFIVESDIQIIGFLIGFLSQTYPEDAYIHFVGIHPDYRQQGIGTMLYEQFFQTVQKLGRNQVKCVTSPVNQGSIAFHQHLGFQFESTETQINGMPCHLDYDGVGEHRILFVKHLSANCTRD